MLLLHVTLAIQLGGDVAATIVVEPATLLIAEAQRCSEYYEAGAVLKLWHFCVALAASRDEVFTAACLVCLFVCLFVVCMRCVCVSCDMSVKCVCDMVQSRGGPTRECQFHMIEARRHTPAIIAN